MLNRKLEKIEKVQSEKDIDELILKGGAAPLAETPQVPKEQRIHLRLENDLVKDIDYARKAQAGFVSRNTWIVQAIIEKLKKET